jgi:hypothetical protein
VFGPFGRPAHVTGSPAPAVGATHQMLPIGKMLLIKKMLSIGQMLLILPAPAVGAAPHDIVRMFFMVEYFLLDVLVPQLLT